MDRVVLAIDGEERLALTACFGGNEIPRRDQTFLIGESDCFAGFDTLLGRFQSGDADNGADDEVGVGMS